MPTADTRSGGNWLPGRRAAQLELAKRWSPLVNLQKTYWKIPQTEITRLDNAILLVGDSQESFDNNASPGNRAPRRVPRPRLRHALLQDALLPLLKSATRF